MLLLGVLPGRDSPTIVSKGKEYKQVPPSVSGNDASKKNGFYALRDRIWRWMMVMMIMVSNNFFTLVVMSSFYERDPGE